MAKKNILFVLAHMDDEVYSSGTIMKLIEDGHKVHLLTICGKGRSIDVHETANRIKALKKIQESVGFTKFAVLEYYDLSLGYLTSTDCENIKYMINQEIKSYKIDWVFTNHSNDQHLDHRTVSELVRLCCREDRSSVKKLYECYIPGSTERGTDGIKNFNTVIEIDKYVQRKREFLKLYGTELSASNNADSTIIGNMYFGKLNGCNHAEIFKLIYSKCF